MDESCKKVKDDFPGLETAEDLSEHRNTVLDFMSKDSAICARSQDKVIGALLFSKSDNMLCFLAVEPEYRRQHIAEKMVSYMLTFMVDSGSNVLLQHIVMEFQREWLQEHFTNG